MRGSGILLHISSLPNPYGIGTFGKEAYEFIDFLKAANQRYWQVLPLGPTSYGDSPYQTFSAFAGNPYFIDFDLLKAEQLLESADYIHMRSADRNVDYLFQYRNRFSVLEKAFQRFLSKEYDERFTDFCNQTVWLEDYALFMAIKSCQPEGSFASWNESLKKRDPEALRSFREQHSDQINFWKFVQYQFFRQWNTLKTYANKNGIEIIGDMPIYVAYDSSDVWANPQYFQLDDNLKPTAVAGVPPDRFSFTGQLWGNPLYNYALMEAEGFRWWIDRIKESYRLFDIVRIDHFRGFESYYSVPAADKTAENGVWVKGPGRKLFSKVKESLGNLRIIAEDLGFLTPEVYRLLKDCGFPGMKILQFGFDRTRDSEYAPHNYSKNSVVYPGTHDNPTLKGWIESLAPDDYRYFSEYLGIAHKKEAVKKAILECMKSVSDTVIIPIADYLELNDEARFNIPSTLGFNWRWRLIPQDLTEELAKQIRHWSWVYRRNFSK